MTGTYPQGWLDGGTAMTDHNKYDVTELFYRGWIHMVPGNARWRAPQSTR